MINCKLAKKKHKNIHMHQNCHKTKHNDRHTYKKTESECIPLLSYTLQQSNNTLNIVPPVNVHWASHRTALVGTTSIQSLKELYGNNRT